MKSPFSFFLRLTAAVTNMAFVFTMTGMSVMAGEAEIQQAKMQQTQAAMEQMLSKLSKAELREMQGKYIDMISNAMADLERAMEDPEGFKAEMIEKIETGMADLREESPAEGPAAQESMRNFEQALRQMKNSTPNYEAAYKQLSELREKLESLGVANVFKCIAAVFATIFLAVGGVLIGGVLVIAGVALAVGSLWILVILTDIPEILIGVGTGMAVGSCAAIGATWRWALR